MLLYVQHIISEINWKYLHDTSNELFCLSFECILQDFYETNRIQWHSVGGTSRFLPDLMIDIWPKCFTDFKNQNSSTKCQR